MTIEQKFTAVDEYCRAHRYFDDPEFESLVDDLGVEVGRVDEELDTCYQAIDELSNRIHHGYGGGYV